MQFIEGGVCAAQGFKAAGIHCGIRKNKSKRDLALVVSDRRASAAGVYTQNLVKGAPILVTRENIADGYAQAIICNSGNANTCNADGVDIARAMCALVEKHAHIPAGDVIVASTGVIGQPLRIDPIAQGMDALVGALSLDGAPAAEAIMTTDTVRKEAAVEFCVGGVSCRLGGMAKGSGMIHPNMATMLVFVTTDAAIAPGLLKKALLADAQKSFNMISVDGDTSTNDTLCIMANGASGAPYIQSEGDDYAAFCQALNAVTTRLCRMMAKDGEGATKLLECRVTGAQDEAVARMAAKSVICSSLVKAAMFGADANWGRVLCALGYSGAPLDVNRIDVRFISAAGEVEVCRSGAGVPFSEEKAKQVLSRDEIVIAVELKRGRGERHGLGLRFDLRLCKDQRRLQNLTGG